MQLGIIRGALKNFRRIKEHKENGLYRVKFNLAKSQPLANKFDVLINFRIQAYIVLLNFALLCF